MSEVEEPASEKSDDMPMLLIACMTGTAIFLIFAMVIAFNGPSDSQVAQALGATQCTDTGYEIKNRLDGSSERLYDCEVDGRRICAVYRGDGGRDVTDIAGVVFAGSLGMEKPKCLE